MPLERVTDENYSAFMKYQRAVLVATTTYCPVCQFYKPIVGIVSNLRLMQAVKFGEAVLDQGQLIQLKRDLGPFEGVPTTLYLMNGQEAARGLGPLQPEMLALDIISYLELESTKDIATEESAENGLGRILNALGRFVGISR